MSRIGKKPIVIPQNVKVTIQDGYLSAKGPKGELNFHIPNGIEAVMENNELQFNRKTEDKRIRAFHGLTRALSANIIEGVTNGFTRVLQIEGVGYKAEQRGKRVLINIGYSHPVLIIGPDEISFEVPNPVTIKISGIDKQLVGAIASKIRSIRPPEPYKGKGIRYEGEQIRRKAGKTATK